MIISMKKVNSLSHEELSFLYSMLVYYGEMYETIETNNKKNKKYKKKNKKRDSTKPNLYDFNDPLWKTCKDKKFLLYRYIIEKTNY